MSAMPLVRHGLRRATFPKGKAIGGGNKLCKKPLRTLLRRYFFHRQGKPHRIIPRVYPKGVNELYGKIKCPGRGLGLRAWSLRFFLTAKNGKRRNTLCISSFSGKAVGEKDWLKAEEQASVPGIYKIKPFFHREVGVKKRCLF